MSKSSNIQWVDFEAAHGREVPQYGVGALVIGSRRGWVDTVFWAAFDYASRGWAALVAWNSARRTEAQLRSCSDFLLKDIGIHRSEISAVAAGRGYRRGPGSELYFRTDRTD